MVIKTFSQIGTFLDHVKLTVHGFTLVDELVIDIESLSGFFSAMGNEEN